MVLKKFYDGFSYFKILKGNVWNNKTAKVNDEGTIINGIYFKVTFIIKINT